MRRLSAVLVALFGTGCGSLPFHAERDPWAGLAAPAAAPDFHLVVVWRRPPQGPARLAEPDALSDSMVQAARARKLGDPRSRQTAENVDELLAVLPLWRPQGPVLWVSAAPSWEEHASSGTLTVTASARFQPALFDTGGAQVQAKASVGIAAGAEASEIRALERTAADALARDLYFKLGRLKPSKASLFVFPGESEAMKRGFAAARAGDWKAAAEAWEASLAAKDRETRAHANLSVAREMLGDYEGAARHADAVREAGLLSDWLVSGAWSGADRAETLRGMAALRETPLPAGALFHSAVAVMPLDNETTDLLADEQVRKALHDAFAGRGFAVRPVEEVDERLRSAGVTQGGQLRALPPGKLRDAADAPLWVSGSVEEFRVVPLGPLFHWQVRARFRLVRASDGKVLLERVCEVQRRDLSQGRNAALKTAVKLVDLLWRKNRKAVLAEESAGVAAAFLRPIPEFLR